MLLPLWSLGDRITSPRVDRSELALVLCAGLAAAFLLVPRRYAIVLPLVVLAL